MIPLNRSNTQENAAKEQGWGTNEGRKEEEEKVEEKVDPTKSKCEL